MRYLTLILLLACTQVQAIDEAAKAETIERCQIEMDGHGAAMVKFCVDMDIEAWGKIQKLKTNYADVIARCEVEMDEHGYAMIEFCASMDIEASEALSKY